MPGQAWASLGKVIRIFHLQSQECLCLEPLLAQHTGQCQNHGSRGPTPGTTKPPQPHIEGSYYRHTKTPEQSIQSSDLSQSLSAKIGKLLGLTSRNGIFPSTVRNGWLGIYLPFDLSAIGSSKRCARRTRHACTTSVLLEKSPRDSGDWYD